MEEPGSSDIEQTFSPEEPEAAEEPVFPDEEQPASGGNETGPLDAETPGPDGSGDG